MRGLYLVSGVTQVGEGSVPGVRGSHRSVRGLYLVSGVDEGSAPGVRGSHRSVMGLHLVSGGHTGR